MVQYSLISCPFFRGGFQLWIYNKFQIKLKKNLILLTNVNLFCRTAAKWMSKGITFLFLFCFDEYQLRIYDKTSNKDEDYCNFILFINVIYSSGELKIKCAQLRMHQKKLFFLIHNENIDKVSTEARCVEIQYLSCQLKILLVWYVLSWIQFCSKSACQQNILDKFNKCRHI